MIRTYTVTEMEELSGVTRRTISDYIAKGILAGPSHRGRGARYPQSDIDVLTVVPRLRTLMKKEYPSLKAVASFLRRLSMRDIARLARQASDTSFVNAVRELRVRNSVASLVPHVPPEEVEKLLGTLTPGQIRGVDTGRYHLGAVLDMNSLLKQNSREDSHDVLAREQMAMNGNSAVSRNQRPHGFERHPSSEDDYKSLHSILGRLEQKSAQTATDLQALRTQSGQPAGSIPALDEIDIGHKSIDDRLVDIARRLERLESILETE